MKLTTHNSSISVHMLKLEAMHFLKWPTFLLVKMVLLA